MKPRYTKKEPTKKDLKKQAWKLFSMYIRRKYADCNGIVPCVTCGIHRHWKEMQAGHFIDSRNNTVLFNEELVFPQCCACNMFRHGNKVAYTIFMLRRGYTAKEITEMVNMKHKTKKMSIVDYMDLIDKYTDLNAGLDLKEEK